MADRPSSSCPPAQDQFIDGGIKIRLRILVDGANKIFYCIFHKGDAPVAKTRNVPRVLQVDVLSGGGRGCASGFEIAVGEVYGHCICQWKKHWL